MTKGTLWVPDIACLFVYDHKITTDWTSDRNGKKVGLLRLQALPGTWCNEEFSITSVISASWKRQELAKSVSNLQ